MRADGLASAGETPSPQRGEGGVRGLQRRSSIRTARAPHPSLSPTGSGKKENARRRFGLRRRNSLSPAGRGWGEGAPAPEFDPNRPRPSPFPLPNGEREERKCAQTVWLAPAKLPLPSGERVG